MIERKIMKSLKPKAVILCDSRDNVSRVFGLGRLEKLKKLLKLHPGIISGADFNKHITMLSECKYIFSTWGMPVLNDAQIDQLEKLKAIFYAAGSVKYFAEPYLNKEIKVISAWAENAKPTAAFALGQVLLACKRYFGSYRYYKSNHSNVWSIEKEGFYGCKVGILGAGKVGRRLAELLKPMGVDMLIYDPYIGANEAKKLGGRKATLVEIFEECRVVSNHLPDIKETKGILGGKLFRSMAHGATFINTGRGAQVRENELIRVLRKRKDLTALLDVTEPEPPKKNSPLFRLPNIIISPHIAGAYGKEQVLLADCVIDECRALMAGRPLKYAVTMKMLRTLG
jgi:phosphoglycerate dehydrogenase-like enzyme